MNWFKHDTDATTDAKLKKLIIRYGAVGYAVYFHCLELIAAEVSETNITFELEHDAEIIADDLRIHGDSSKSGIEIVEEIMRYMVDLNLFEENNGHIFCFKLLKRLDYSQCGVELRKVVKAAKEKLDDGLIMTNHDKEEKIMTNHDEYRADKIRKDKIRKDKDKNLKSTQKDDSKKVYGSDENVKLSDDEYSRLVSEYGKEKTDMAIEFLSSYKIEKGYKTKDDNRTLRRWVFDAISNKSHQTYQKGSMIQKSGCDEVVNILDAEVNPF